MTWNGKDVPPELRELPAGRYVVEAVEDEAPALSPEEEAGIEAALESYRQGRVDAKRDYQRFHLKVGPYSAVQLQRSSLRSPTVRWARSSYFPFPVHSNDLNNPSLRTLNASARKSPTRTVAVAYRY